MAYTAPQIGVILLKADRTMYKIGQIAYENMFAEDNEALDYERDVIFIYKKAVEFADDFFVGTEKLDKVVERLATKISAYDYGELNPIYADAATVNIPSVVAGAALNDLTDVTIANLLDNQFLRYNAATGQWINVGPGSAVRSSQAFIATAGQTVFTTSAPFDAGLFDLYVNGVKLNSLSYTTMGEYQITLNDPCAAGDIVDVVIYDPNTGINPTANTLNDLTDVNIGPLANKQGLYYNSASGLWENGLVFVPYTGATAAVDLGEFEIRAGQFTLDTSPTGTATVGTTRWNDSIGSSETTLKGGSVILKNGVDLVARVVNKVTPNTTLTKASYAAVRISGAQGQRLAVAYAQANNDANSADTIGLVTETIATNQEGFIMTMGSLEGINTTGSLQGETWADGDVLYLSPTVPGGITNVKPTGLTGHIVVVGYVEYAHANNGKIYVKTMNGWELDELHNVNINIGTLANGDVLKYNATTQLWENGVDAGGITGTGVAGQVPYFTGASAVAGSNNLFWDAANSRLGIGTNTPTESLHVPGQVRIGSTVNGYLFNSNTITTYGNIFWGIQADRSFQITDHTYASTYLRINRATGNTSLGSSADAGQRLQVYGDTLLRGSGATSATTALTVQNSSSTNLLTIDNSGFIEANTSTSSIFVRNGIVFGATSAAARIGPSASNAINVRFTQGSTNLLGAYGAGIQNSSYLFSYPASNNTDANTNSLWGIVHTFNPTSGTSGYIMAGLQPTINQTGGANGITRGLYVNPTLTAAADWRSIQWDNNTGWGLYGEGTAVNYLGGRLQIGGTTVQNYINLWLSRNISGFSFSYGIVQDGIVQSDVITAAFGFTNSMRFAASVTTPSYSHFYAEQGNIGAGATITNQFGFRAHESMTGATNNYGFYGNIASGTGRWNLYMAGTADNYLAGNLGIGITPTVKLHVSGDTILKGSGATSATTALTVQNSSSTNLFTVRNDGVMAQGGGADAGVNFYMQKSLSGSVYPTGIYMVSTITSTSTNGATMFISDATTQAASFTLPKIEHFKARQTTFGAGSTVTNQYGFFAEGTLTGATNNYGFYGNIAFAVNRWNLYMNGTADNYLAGSLGIGSTALTGKTLVISKNITGSTIPDAVQNNGVIQSDVTNATNYFITGASTAAAAFTLPTLRHYIAVQGTFGAGSSVTNQYGYFVHGSMVGATNNYGFYGDIAGGTGRWNLYMAGTADNYLAGNLLVGGTSVYGATITSYATSIRSGGIGIRNSAGTAAGFFGTYAAGSGSGSTDILAESAGFISISTGGSEKHKLFANGNVSIGTTSDLGVRLGVVGDTILRGSGATSATTALTVQNSSSTNLFTVQNNGAARIAGTATLAGGAILQAIFINQGQAIEFQSAGIARFYNAGNTQSVDIYHDGNGVFFTGAATSNSSIKAGGGTINASAILQADSTTKGFLPPRMTTTQKNAIATPAAGLVVYDTTLNKLCVYTTAWETITSA